MRVRVRVKVTSPTATSAGWPLMMRDSVAWEEEEERSLDDDDDDDDDARVVSSTTTVRT